MKLVGDIDVFVEFKGWRFFAPFRCMCCGVWISISQFCFGRACGACDCGRCQHPSHRGSFSGPREPVIDRDGLKYFIPENHWLNPATGLESHPNDEQAKKMDEIIRSICENHL